MKEQLYQVRVLLSDDKAINVFPAMVKDAAQRMVDEITKQIRLGREKTWRDPIIVPIYN